jgi:SAM-dependent methyltransferase
MDHVDYFEWANYLQALFRHFNRDVCTILEGGGGTGSLAEELDQRGYQVALFDRSLDMLRQAKKKIAIPIWQGDLLQMPISRKWDVFLCMYDTIQYLDEDELKRLFKEVQTALNHKGLFVFDVVTEKNVLTYWADHMESVKKEDWETVRQSWYVRNKRCLHTEITFRSTREKKIFREHHRQCIFQLQKLKDNLKKTGWSHIHVFHEFTFQNGSEQSDRVHFVASQEGN